MPSRLTYLLGLVLACGLLQVVARGEEPEVDFDGQIAPILVSHCLDCHRGAQPEGNLDLSQADRARQGGDSGAAFVPGAAADSLLWQRISKDEMPPKKPLTDDEKKTIERWIAAGAKWGTDPVDPFRVTTAQRAGYDWWSLKPLVRAEVPPAQTTSETSQAIDRFIRARLDKAGLQPSPPADRRTLIRRVTLDVTGLPPTPEEVDDFVRDNRPEAYQKLVERLLASPHYGERWGRHWLDLARFGESNGFEYDEPRANAWRYRDWVIDALNQDLPFDEFARQQLAGDVLYQDDPAAVKATGFLVAGPYDTAGQNQQSAAMKAVVRQDELEDLVGTVCQTFLGLTVNCARCHDHKFDPIRQAEYYRLTAALGGVRHGERDVTSSDEAAAAERRKSEAQQQLTALTSQIEAIEKPVREEILSARGRVANTALVAPAPVARWDFDRDARDAIGAAHGTLAGGATVEDGQLKLSGGSAHAVAAPLKQDLTAKTLEAWVRLENLRQAGGGVISVQSTGGGTFDAIVFGELEPARWMAGSDSFARTQSFEAPAETEADQRLTHVAIVYEPDGTITAYRNGVSYGKPYRGSGPVTFKKNQTQVLFGMRHAPAGGNRMLAGAIERAQLYDRALNPEEIAASAAGLESHVNEVELVARLSPDDRERREELLAQRQKLSEEIARPAKSMSYAVKPREPDATHVLLRGDLRQPAELVAAGGVASIVGLSADFGLDPAVAEAERRAALARWITNKNNPLFARVIVNRLWHYHFGVGLVDTPNDFGFNGGRPSHPELLDWLAGRLIEQNYSLKALHREILLSATYQQSSAGNVTAAAQDHDNRLLWRKSPQRLEAEAVRDCMLAVAGELNVERGGPGFRDSRQILRSGTYTYEPGDPVGAEFNRRSIYRAWIRGGRSGLLDAFDCPDPSTTSPKRAVTTTPLQALSLLNNSFVLRTANQFAARLARDAGSDVQAQIRHAYRLAYARDPSPRELATAEQVVQSAGLNVLTRAIFNSNEFLYVD